MAKATTLFKTSALSALVVLLFAGSASGAELPQLSVGDTAPNFLLEGTDGQMHDLSAPRGDTWVVVAWFPKAYTRGCTIECKSLAENGHLIREFDVNYYMASVDPLEDNAGFAAKEGADFPLLSDPTKATAQAYGVLNPRGYANRHTFYIDASNTIVAIDRSVAPATSAEDMASTLAQLGAPAAQ